MTNAANHETIVLTGNLLLSELSEKKFPDITHYRKTKTINLQQLTNTDSAGLAYLAQIKSHYSDLNFTGVSQKILVLAQLYGLSFIFKS